MVSLIDYSTGLIVLATPTTDDTGAFTIDQIPSDAYRVQVKQGQALSRIANPVVVTAGGNPTQDFGTLSTGDANDDNRVDILDFSSLRSAFGQTTTCTMPSTQTTPCPDFDASGLVDIVDFSLLRSNFGQAGPEPAP